MAKITKLSTEADVINTLCDKIEIIANSSIASNSKFRIGLSGGSLIQYLAKGLPNIRTTWSKWQLFFCDERYVPESDDDSTFGAYKAQLIPAISELSENQFIKIRGDIELNECAVDYELQIRKEFGVENDIPVFDLLLLGMGPDGHTCSLFPGHQLLKEHEKLIAPINDSPKPPPKRVTMTYKLINEAKNVLFAMAGSGKADMVKRILVDKELLPAGLIQLSNGTLEWIVDNAAGAHL